MSKLISLVGQRFGRLTVIARADNQGQHTCWLCLCDCGEKIVTHSQSIREGRTQSCGCYRVEVTTLNRTKHGLVGSKEYMTWTRLKGRCTNPKSQYWNDYGGRGIKCCAEWLESFQAFSADVGDAPSPQHSIDRIDVNGDYEPGNVRWATVSQQASNKRNCVQITYAGVKYPSLAQAARAIGVDRDSLKYLHRVCNLPIEEAVQKARKV